MSIATITLTDADDGTVEVVITAANPRENSNALGMTAHIQAFIADLVEDINTLVEDQAKAEVAKPSSVICPKKELILPDSLTH